MEQSNNPGAGTRAGSTLPTDDSAVKAALLLTKYHDELEEINMSVFKDVLVRYLILSMDENHLLSEVQVYHVQMLWFMLQEIEDWQKKYVPEAC